MGCSNCGQELRLTRGRCNTCYRYWRRTGRERERGLIVRANASRGSRQQTIPSPLHAFYLRTLRRFDETHRLTARAN